MIAPIGDGINSSPHMFLTKIYASPGISQDSLMDMFYVHPTDRTLSVIEEIQAACERTEALLLKDMSEAEKNLFADLLMQSGSHYYFGNTRFFINGRHSFFSFLH